MATEFEVQVSSGSLLSATETSVHFPHWWTRRGVTVKTDFTGAHLLHLAVAGCVLNDVHREAEALGVDVRGVRVVAGGSFDTKDWRSIGIEYTVEIDTDADVERLLRRVDEVAEIPRAIRLGATVSRRTSRLGEQGASPPVRPICEPTRTSREHPVTPKWPWVRPGGSG